MSGPIAELLSDMTRQTSEFRDVRDTARTDAEITATTRFYDIRKFWQSAPWRSRMSTHRVVLLCRSLEPETA